MSIEPELDILAPAGTQLQECLHSQPLPPFSAVVLNFLDSLSKAVREDLRSSSLPDVYAFGFWCRSASLQAMRNAYPDIDHRLGRGVVFHIAPSNVPVNFAYSLVAGLLAGNANIVRLPSADFAQVRVLVDCLNRVLDAPRHAGLRSHIRLVRYPRHAHAITEFLSSQCDVRMVWGGDETIRSIRSAALPARAFDVTFADRYSFCAIEADAYLRASDRKSLARGFFNDTYLFDQNACTAPHLVVWTGSAVEVEEARKAFWDELQHCLEDRYTLQAAASVDKLNSALRFAASHPGARILPGPDNRLTRVEVPEVPLGIENWRSHCGLFFESRVEALSEIAPIINRRFQTLAYFGFSRKDLHDFITGHRLHGIDRVVPVGRTLEFTLQWDGHDLAYTLSRVISGPAISESLGH